MAFLQYLINGIYIGAIYAVIALGYTMVYGIAKMLNFAHGDVIMVGAYMSYAVTSSMGIGMVPSILIAMVICTLLGIIIEGLAYKPLRGTSSLAVLITAIGVSYFLQNAAQPPGYRKAPVPVWRSAEDLRRVLGDTGCCCGGHGRPDLVCQ